MSKPRRLESYLLGAWRAGAGEGKPLAHAATGEIIAHVGSDGLDFQGALAWARAVGGPNLRSRTVHERALMLKAIGAKLMEIKEAFYAESHATGATRSDSAVDIDGGIGTMLTYASRARRELPHKRVLTDGGVEPLSRDSTFSAQHILSPLHGVAIHINAFNFPVWGMLEKIAPALIAGVPCLVKPASQTAYLTESMVRRIVDMEILPEGALQLVCGGVGDMLDHVEGQDVVTFTGSAATGRKLKSRASIVDNAVRFNMEADSLNAAILGVDAAPGTPEFDLFIRECAREMTAKAGQKCTAIRRIIVPRPFEDAVIEALSARLDQTVVGLPDHPETRMGSLVSLHDRDNLVATIKGLQGSSEIVCGDPDAPRLASGDAARGAFVNPVLMRCASPLDANAPHEIEPFGPVATVMAYGDLDDAVTLAKRGKGSLVASVFTNDHDVAESAVIGLAPLHGRVLIGNRASSQSSTGHGAPLAPLVHGGPGRAGGGEELGGVRGVFHYMQRTAVQGAPRLLASVTDEWSEGAATRSDGHPFRKSLAELRLGDQFLSEQRVITREDVEHFATFTGDTFYAHMDAEAAKANPFFEDRVAHGYLVVSFAAGLFVEPHPGPVLANYGVDGLRFLTPVYFGDALRVRLTCKSINPRAGADHGEVRWDTRVANQRDELVAEYDVLTMVAKHWP